jgi:hypothetical protein
MNPSVRPSIHPFIHFITSTRIMFNFDFRMFRMLIESAAISTFGGITQLLLPTAKKLSE